MTNQNLFINLECDRAARTFAAHVGEAPAVEGYGVQSWRQWLITGNCHGMWFVVPKAAPLTKPKAYKCSLAQVKAWLRAES